MQLKATGLKALKVLGWILLVLFLLALATLTIVDRSAIEEQDFYKNTFAKLDSLALDTELGEEWLAGWARTNMTPAKPAELVGYAPRGTYDYVADSSFVKAITLQNGKKRIAWLSYELLIVHPHLSEAVHRAIRSSSIAVDQIIFTATHTHSGLGGYMPGPLGELAFGGLDEEIVQLIAKQSVLAIELAISNEEEASLSYRKADAGEWVSNRFVKGGEKDPFIRQVIFRKKSGPQATLMTFSAHATCLSTDFMGLSGDYPFYLAQTLEQAEFDLVLFASGTVGSHRPNRPGNSLEDTQKYAQEVAKANQLYMTSYSTINQKSISTGRLNVELREPHLRVSDDIRLRPWLFRYLLGETNVHFDLTRVGNTLFISSSGEISGVFYETWEKEAQSKNLNLIITTFNGGYMGYITPDSLYDRHFHEVREMNWYGPGNGRYYDELIQEIIARVASDY
ncbi:neutral/alkaline non-lysosomal ceramidase N-terminal domain-containing protein [Algoriphagus namhaensis]